MRPPVHDEEIENSGQKPLSTDVSQMRRGEMRMTRHADRRMCQRGIGENAIDFTLRWGHVYHRTGICFHVLRRRDIVRSGVVNTRVLRWEGTTVLVEDGTVISVYKNRDVAHIRRKAKNDLKKLGRQRLAA
jgi:hypothetical protein